MDTAIALRRTGLRVVPHIAARSLDSRAHLRRVVRALSEVGVDELFVVGGDGERPVGELSSAIDVLEALASMDVPSFSIGVAAYPEGHPRIPGDVLMQALVAKQPFATYLVTQMSFDSGAIARWIDRAERAGVTLPVYLCLPGRVRLDRLVRIGMRLGIGESLRYLEKQRSLLGALLGSSPLYDPWMVIRGLAAGPAGARKRIVGIHWSTFNEVEATLSWLDRRRAELARASEAGVAAAEQDDGS